MVYIHVCYEDGKEFNLQHITKITYVGSEKTVEVPEEKLPTHLYPIGKSLWIHSNNGISVINGNGLRLIEVAKE